MRKVIEGLVYDTETAVRIGNYSNDLGQGDFKNLDETLYRTKNGRFFLHGEGGAMTRWAEPVGNMRAGGEGIKALSTEEALEWSEQHDLDAKVIERYFQVEEA